MRYLVICIVLISFFSCENEKDKIKILSANVNGDNISFARANAQRYRDIENGDVLRFNYHIFNYETPGLHIEALDSSLIKTEFYFPLVKAKYSFIDSKGNGMNYTAVSGGLKITNEHDGIIFGTYFFKLINKRDIKDTIEINSGRFEITLEEYERIRD